MEPADQNERYLDPAVRKDSWTNVREADEYFEFFDCSETYEELQSLNNNTERRMSAEALNYPVKRRSSRGWLCGSPDRPTQLLEAKADAPSMPAAQVALRVRHDNPEIPCPPDNSTKNPEDVNEHLVPVVQEIIRQKWRERIENGDVSDKCKENLKQGFPELEEWTNLVTVRRMLRAGCGDQTAAAGILMKAINFRLQEREMFRTMRCKVVCDMRVIGRDSLNRPVIYLCARSQKAPMKEVIPQLCLAFEAATKLVAQDGQVVLVADCHRLSASMNCDLMALKELADNFGTVFADRLNFVLMVDFSIVAQTVWRLCKPFLTERTQKKINFVNEAAARKLAEERFAAPTCERILSAFDINRDKNSTEEEREAHARRTSICDVPLGEPRADEAG